MPVHLILTGLNCVLECSLVSSSTRTASAHTSYASCTCSALCLLLLDWSPPSIFHFLPALMCPIPRNPYLVTHPSSLLPCTPPFPLRGQPPSAWSLKKAPLHASKLTSAVPQHWSMPRPPTCRARQRTAGPSLKVSPVIPYHAMQCSAVQYLLLPSKNYQPLLSRSHILLPSCCDPHKHSGSTASPSSSSSVIAPLIPLLLYSTPLHLL